jgi:hypothetical protein
MFMFCGQNEGQSHRIMTNNKSVENVENFRSLGMTLRKQYCRNACYLAV